MRNWDSETIKVGLIAYTTMALAAWKIVDIIMWVYNKI